MRKKEIGLDQGNKVSFEILGKKEFILRKVHPFDYEYHHNLSNTLSEWNSKEDDEAFNDL